MMRKNDLELAKYQFNPSLIGRQEQAEYKLYEIDAYKGNPYIEALPPIFEEEYVAVRVKRYPSYNEEQRKLGSQLRMHLIQQIADYVECMPQHLLVEQRFSRLIRHGYNARNPLTPEYNRQYHVGIRTILDKGVDHDGKNAVGIRSTAAGFAILGVSGQGKTTAVESTLLLYPQVIHHSEYADRPFIQKQLVWLKLNCPYDGSIKGLCINFLQSVDATLGTTYFQKYVSRGVTVDILISFMAQIATLHGLGLLVIDEIQFLSTMKSGGAERMLNYFTQLINTIGVPIVLLGTYKAVKLLSGSFSQARRSTGQGDLIFDRLSNGEEWAYFVERLWKYQWTAKPTKLSDALKNVIYDLSQGIIDIAVKMYMLAQWQAIGDSEDEKITGALLKNVAKEHMQLVQPMLAKLKRNNTDPGIEDLYPQWDALDQFLKNSKEKANLQGEIRSHVIRDKNVEQDQEKYLALVKTAIDFGADSENAQKIAHHVLQHNELEKELSSLRHEVLKNLTVFNENVEKDKIELLSLKNKPKKTRAKTEPNISFDPKDLRNIIPVIKKSQRGKSETNKEITDLII